MMKLFSDNKAKKVDTRKRKEELEIRLRGDKEDEEESFINQQMRQVTQESIRSHYEWEDRQQFR